MATTEAKEVSEEWFERYLLDHDLRGGEDHHPDLGIATRPDYRVPGPTGAAVCEVKEFTTSGMHERFAKAGPRQPLSLSDEEVYGDVRRKISYAAAQLKPLAAGGDALVVVLANPHGIHVPLARADDIAACMYGNHGYSVPIERGTGRSGYGQHVFLRDGALTARHRYLSAVATLHRGTFAAGARDAWFEANRHRWARIENREERARTMLRLVKEELDPLPEPEGDFYFVRLYSTISTVTGDAVPAPRELFNGPRDQYWAVNPETWDLELVHGAAAD
jgi:hypothetical protein